MTRQLRRVPILVGIAGPTASAKTTLAEQVQSALPDISAVHIRQDDYYRDLSHLPLKKRNRQNFDHPDAIEIDLFARHLRRLQRAHPIHKPRYDFKTHRRLPDLKTVRPASVIIAEGTLVLAVSELREQFQLRVYVDAPLHVCLQRRIRRDTQNRGRTRESVVRQFARTVRPMHEKFVIPSQQYADITVDYQNVDDGTRRIASRLISPAGGTMN